MFLLLLTIAIFTFALWIYKYGTKNGNYFKNTGVPSLKPKFLFGNSSEMYKRELSINDFIYKLYNTNQDSKIFGFYDLRRPVLLVRDPELLKKIAIKYSDNFIDHRSVIDESVDPVFGKNLVALKGQAWKNMRSTLSPAFTGSKMRLMFELISKCGQQLNQYLIDDIIIKSNENYIIEMKNFFQRFANDVIATCAFGIEINSLQNRDNEFFKMGARVSDMKDPKTRLKAAGFLFIPKIMKFLKIKLLNEKDEKFFRSAILDTMDYREKNNIIRPDMINLLLNAKKGQLKHNSNEKSSTNEFSAVEEHEIGKNYKHEWTDDDFLAQCLVFFLAGFDTISTALGFIGYELALNPDIQNKLIHEIDSIKNELNGKSLDYDSLQKMKYLDMVVSETLRKWPPAAISDRVCVKETIINHEDLNIKFEKDMNIWIPIYGFHRDPKYFPNPEKFDPERFSDERKHEINPLAYMPFGIGPRNCIGSRFALMEVKAVLYYILKDFTFEVSAKTEIPYKFGVKNSTVMPDNGLWLKIAQRNK